MITLPKKKRAPLRETPKKTVLFGAPKVGKTSMLAQLEDNLIIDLEAGTEEHECLAVITKDDMDNWQASLKNWIAVKKQIVAAYKKGEYYHYITIDTIDKLTELYEKFVCNQHGVATIGDLEYGKGYTLVRESVMRDIQTLSACTPHLIIVGHLKKSLLGTGEIAELAISTLDLPGKFKNILAADVNAIGLIHRDGEEQLKVSFKATEATEGGTRTPYLAGKIVDFKWDTLFPKDKLDPAIAHFEKSMKAHLKKIAEAKAAKEKKQAEATAAPATQS